MSNNCKQLQTKKLKNTYTENNFRVFSESYR